VCFALRSCQQGKTCDVCAAPNLGVFHFEFANQLLHPSESTCTVVMVKSIFVDKFLSTSFSVPIFPSHGPCVSRALTIIQPRTSRGRSIVLLLTSSLTNSLSPSLPPHTLSLPPEKPQRPAHASSSTNAPRLCHARTPFGPQ
jgi:hypothetical protein